MEPTKFIHLVTVINNTQICEDHYEIILEDNGYLSQRIKPGQFVNIAIPQRADLLLRRPFSVAKTDPAGRLLHIVYRVVGEGTRAMVELVPGDKMDFMGPLGNGWHLPETPGNCLLLGGGCGVAPLWGLAEQLVRDGSHVFTVMGFQSRNKVFGEAVFRHIEADVTVTTDDGSYGCKGFVCDHLEPYLNQNIGRAYISGPIPMIRTVIPPLLEKNIAGEVTLEEIMGCGYGVCFSCVTDIEKDGRLEKQRICTEGPIFSIGEVKW